MHCSNFGYRSVLDPRLELRDRLCELARARMWFGYQRLHVLLWREGWTIWRELTYRLYTEEGRQLRSKLLR